MILRGWSSRLVTVVASGVLLVGCTSDPKLEDVAPDFERDANEIFVGLADSYATDPSAVELTADGSTDVECDDGGARREFSGEFPIREAGDLDETLDNITAGIVVAFENDHGYELGGDYYDRDDRNYTASGDDENYSFELRTISEPAPTLTMTGETVCAD